MNSIQIERKRNRKTSKILKKRRRVKRKNRTTPTRRMLIDDAGGKRGLKIKTNKRPKWIDDRGERIC